MQFMFHARFFQLICAKVGVDWTSARTSKL